MLGPERLNVAVKCFAETVAGVNVDTRRSSVNGAECRDGGAATTTRQKRLRTSFKQHQLRVLKNYFALNHNPDAKDLKQLSQKTGLGKRILQVRRRRVNICRN